MNMAPSVRATHRSAPCSNPTSFQPWRARAPARALRRRPRMAPTNIGRHRRPPRPLPRAARSAQGQMVDRRLNHRDTRRTHRLARRTRRNTPRPPRRDRIPNPTQRLRTTPTTTTRRRHQDMATRPNPTRMGNDRNPRTAKVPVVCIRHCRVARPSGRLRLVVCA